MSKKNFPHFYGITPKRVTSGGAHLRGLAPGQHSSEETSQRWRADIDTVFRLTRPGIKLKTSGSIEMPLTTSRQSTNKKS